MNVELLEQVEANSKKAPKEAYLAQLDEQGQRLVKMALDPEITFGITDDGEFEQFEPDTKWSIEKFWFEFEALLPKLAARELTGNAANNAAQHIFENAPTRLDLKWAARILNRNLRAGFDIRTYNKVFGAGSVEKFSVQLADTYDGDELRGVWYAQPKLDGNRVILMDGKAWSRNGKLYTSCDHILSEFSDSFWTNWVVDGEMMGNLGFDQSSGALRRIDEKGRTKAEFTYWVFDLIMRDEWGNKRTSILLDRMQNVKNLFTTKFKNVKAVPTRVLSNPSHKDVMDLCDMYVEQGFEGAMVKDSQSPYIFKRGKNLLKVKKFFDADLKIDGFYEGKGKHKGRLGGVYVSGMFHSRMVKSECGSGFDDDLREEIWGNKEKWLGATVQIQFQELTPKDSLRFPVFIMRRKDKE